MMIADDAVEYQYMQSDQKLIWLTMKIKNKCQVKSTFSLMTVQPTVQF